MKNEISPEVFERLVELAALRLDAQESEYLRQQLNLQLAAIHELESIPLDTGLQITSPGVPYPAELRQPLREDQWQPSPAVERIVAQAPQFEDGYIIVPEIPHKKLD